MGLMLMLNTRVNGQSVRLDRMPNVKDEPRRELARCVPDRISNPWFRFGHREDARSVTDPGVGSGALLGGLAIGPVPRAPTDRAMS
jgi:hypothetical protein